MTCLSVTNEKIRAEVWMGETLVAKTPFVKSFSVQEARSQISATFSLNVHIMTEIQFELGKDIVIKAGTRGNLRTIFTGPIDQARVAPVFGQPSYYSLTLSGRGVLSVLENKTFSRRIPPDSEGVYCMITSAGEAVNRFKSLDKKVKSGNHTIIAPNPSPTSGSGENSPLVVHNRGGASSSAKGGLIGALSSPPSQVSTDQGSGGLGVHDHSDLTKGGPAFGVYSAD